MSVSAHRIITIEYADATFNLNDEKIWNFLEPKILDNLDSDGGGYFDLSIDTLKELTKIVDPTTKTAILADIKQAEEKGERFVLYSCF